MDEYAGEGDKRENVESGKKFVQGGRELCEIRGGEDRMVLVRCRAQARVLVVANSFLYFHRWVSRDSEENRRGEIWRDFGELIVICR